MMSGTHGCLCVPRLRSAAAIAAVCLVGVVRPIDGVAASAGGKGLSGSVRGAFLGLRSRVGELETGIESLPDARGEAVRLVELNAEMTEKLKQLQVQSAELNAALERDLRQAGEESVAELEESLRQLRERQEAMERNRQDMGSLSEAEAKVSRLAEEIAELKKETKRLRFKLETLKQALVATESEASAGQDAALEDRVRELRERVAELRREKKAHEADLARVTQRKERGDDSKGDFGRFRKSSKTPHHIVVIGKQAVPIEEPYFEFEWKTGFDRGRLIRYVSKATRVKDGEPVELALAKGGCVAKLLDRCKGESDRLVLLVCPDGVPAFRRIVAEARRRGLGFFWCPHDDTPIRGGIGGGGYESGGR